MPQKNVIRRARPASRPTGIDGSLDSRAHLRPAPDEDLHFQHRRKEFEMARRQDSEADFA
jgi:hypothetical protein